MKRRILSLWLVVSMLLTVLSPNWAAAAENDNMVSYNFGFELGSLASWGLNAYAQTTASIDSASPRSGNYAAKVQFDGTNGALEIDRYTSVNNEIDGKTYYYEVWMKSDAVSSTGGLPQMIVQGFEGNTYKGLLASTPQVSGTTEWTKYSGEFTAAWSGATINKLRLMLRRSSSLGGTISGTWYIDDVLLARKPDSLLIDPAAVQRPIGFNASLDSIAIQAVYGSTQIPVAGSAVNWSIVSGDAAISGNQIVYNGTEEGAVTAQASYLGATAELTVDFVPDHEPPTAPTTAAASEIGISTAKLTWSGATDDVAVTQYRLYETGGTEPVASTAATHYTLTGLQPETSYSYTIVAVDETGKKSAPSAPVTFETLSDIAPAALTVDTLDVIKPATRNLLGANHDWYRSQLTIMENTGLEVRQEYRDLAGGIGLPMPLNRMSGSDSQKFKWKWAIGPLEQRQAQTTWSEPPMKYRFGPIEWIKSARDVDADAKFTWTLNLTLDTPQDHADLAEFLTGDGTGNPNDGTDWAQLRRDLGVQEPADVTIWELGNELDGRWIEAPYGPDSVQTYIDAASAAIQAIRSVSPDAKFAASATSAPWDVEEGWAEWHRTVLEELGDDIDYIVFHPYYLGYPISRMEQYLDVIRDDIVSITGSDRIKLYMSEHAVWPETPPGGEWRDGWWQTHALKGVLGTAQFINRMFARPEVAAAAYHSFQSGPWGIIYKEPSDGTLYLTGIADMLKLFDDSLGDQVVNASLSGTKTDPTTPDNTLTATAMTAGTDEVRLVIVNREAELNRQLTVQELEGYRLVKEVQLTADSMDSYNTSSSAEIERIVQTFTAADPFTEYLVPAKSAVALYLSKLPEEADAPATLSGTTEVAPGQSLQLNYGLHGVAGYASGGIYAQQLELQYDPDLLEFVSASPLQDGVAVVLEDTDTPGQVRLFLASEGPQHAIIADGHVLRLNWTAKSRTSSATADIALNGVVISDGFGLETALDASGHTVSIVYEEPRIEGDVNGDGRVSIGDLGMIAAHYGKTSASADWQLIKQADVNGDGKIDLTDLVTVALKL